MKVFRELFSKSSLNGFGAKPRKGRDLRSLPFFHIKPAYESVKVVDEKYDEADDDRNIGYILDSGEDP